MPDLLKCRSGLAASILTISQECLVHVGVGAPFFRKYGAKYDVDDLLMTAQSYQESQLDQVARRRAGHSSSYSSCP